MTNEEPGTYEKVSRCWCEGDECIGQNNLPKDEFCGQVSHFRERFERALYLAEHLFQMIPREVWRGQGAEWMGQYEGDHWAEQTLAELQEMRSELDV